MLHEEDFGFRGKEPKTRKPVVKAVTKLSKNGNKETEIRTYDGRDGKGLKCRSSCMFLECGFNKEQISDQSIQLERSISQRS